MSHSRGSCAGAVGASARLLALWVAAVVLASAGTARADVLAPFHETNVFTGLTAPTAVRFAPDGRIFVAEQSGLLKVFNGLGDTTPDIAADLRPNVMNNWDRGFLGLAIDPQFPAPGHDYVYVLYTVDAPPGQNPPVWNDACADQTTLGCVTRGRLSRLEIGPNNQMIGPEHILIDNRWCFQFVTHSIGDLHFGPEGALYVSSGEGASFTYSDYGQNAGNPCNDPVNEGGALRSQDILTPGDPQSWDGSLMRLDVSGANAVPWPTNPQVGSGTTDDDAIIAHGFRNPFRFTIHSNTGPQAGEVWIGDVGDTTWEEINRLITPNGPLRNFGWPCYEGGSGVSTPHPGFDAANLPLCEGLYAGTISSLVTASYYAYNHNSQVIPGEQCDGVGGGSITGIAFYENGTYPAEYQNALFFQDYSRKCMWAMLPDAPGGIPNPARRRGIAWGGDGAVDLQVGPGGDLYYAKLNPGVITRLQYFATNTPPTAVIAALPPNGPSPLSVAFDASGSTDPDPGDTLTYSWDTNGDGVFGDASDPDPRFAHITYTKAGQVSASVRVTDSHGAFTIATTVVTVANTPPVATILTPADTLTWRVGDTISFSGQALDPEDGQLPPSAFTWQTILHHCATLQDCHTHLVQSYNGVTSGSFVAPDHPYPSYLEIQLTVKDFGSDWFNPAWSNRRRITFDNSLQATDLVGFPVLVKLDATKIDYSKTQNAGQDLRFVDADGTLLPHQIESWDETGTSTVWVRVPKINAFSTTDSIFVYYGNATAPDGQNVGAVWDSTYSAVWHLGANTGDSTTNANNGANNGTTAVAGQIGSARNFNGAGYIEVPTSPTLELGNSATFEAWIKLSNPSLNDYIRIFDKKPFYSDPQGYDLEYQPSAGFATVLGSGDNYTRAEELNLDNQWHWLVGTVAGGGGRIYLDGVDRTTDFTLTPLQPGSSPLDIGRSPANVAYFQGAIDEVRISNVSRSDDWVRAQYLSMNGTFSSVGAEETPNGLTGMASVNLMPETKVIPFATVPSGLQLSVNSVAQTAPFNYTFITNSVGSVGALSPQSVGGGTQTFSSWSDGGAASHEITATAGAPGLTATFLSNLCGNGVLDAGEQCDDHNTQNGDCCSATCQFEASGSSCNDGNACTTSDTCSAGVCNGGTAAVCNDSNACTQDSCVPATGCVFNPTPQNGTTCNDGNACNMNDTCNGGTCSGSGSVVCNDSNGCTFDSCNPASGCVFDPAPLNGTTCSDANMCTLNDVCANGACAGSPSPDGDGDGQCNAADNCPYVTNPSQSDVGGVGISPPDGIGDGCQCGDLTGEGIVDSGDVSLYRSHLADPVDVPFAADAALKCSVVGSSSDCDILDVAIARRALVGLGPGVAQVCTAAIPH